MVGRGSDDEDVAPFDGRPEREFSAAGGRSVRTAMVDEMPDIAGRQLEVDCQLVAESLFVE